MSQYADWLLKLEPLDPRCAKFAEAAFEKLTLAAMPPTPEHYALWYSYCAGGEPELTRALDQRLKSGQPFTADYCDDLIHKFLRPDIEERAVCLASEKTQDAILMLLKAVQTALASTGRYHEAVENVHGALEQPITVDRFRAIIAGIVVESRNIINEQERLKEQLGQTSTEITALRVNLNNVRHQAETDPLTGIANRRAFDHLLKEATEANDKALSLLMIDIDHFKKFNDTYGHQVGDQVLRLVAALLTQITQGCGTVARYGGEEFSIILPRLDLVEAKTIAETIRRTMAGRQISSREGGPNFGRITLSVGVAQRIPNETPRGLIGRADEALYQAKNSGRNKVASAAAISS